MNKSSVSITLGLICRMRWVSSGRRLLFLATFHSLVSLDIRSETSRSCSCSVVGPKGRKLFLRLIQESLKTLVEFPLPIAFPRWFISRSLPHNIPFQPWDEPELAVTDKKDWLLQYFPYRMRARRQSGLVSILQAIFPKRAWLKSWTSRRPRPPKLLGLVSLSHASQQIFLSPLLLSHQKRISIDCIWLHNPTGSWKQDIAKEGIAERTNCSIVSFPAVERNLVDQPRAFCFIRLTMEAKRSFFFLPKCSGKPKYFPTPPSWLMPSWVFTLSRAARGVLEENETDDLFGFIFCPDAIS